jgi:hypothetical protein
MGRPNSSAIRRFYAALTAVFFMGDALWRRLPP